MQWDNSPHAGFTTGRPWLRVHPNYTHRNVAVQRQDSSSIYNFTRTLLSLRKHSPALSSGDFIPLETTPAGVMAYLRQTDDQSALVALNFSGYKKSLLLPDQDWHVWLGENAPRSGRLILSPRSVHLLGTEPPFVSNADSR
jgi:glycosidase